MTKDFDIFRCKECGYVVSAEDKSNIGTMHAHCEKHTPFWSIANVPELEKYVQRITVTAYQTFEPGVINE